MTQKKVELFIIDPQVGFCQPGKPLFVPGADTDMTRLATMVKRIKNDLNDIHVTLDSHHYFDISHPSFWVDQAGKEPGWFTPLSLEDFLNGKLRPKFPQFYDEVKNYLQALKDNNRYMHIIWPPHCLIGSDEHAVIPDLYEAIHTWEMESDGAFINFVTKGSNYLREHYSGVKAEVEDPKDPTTKLNTKLIQTMEQADEIPVGGQASTHCVANTMRDVVKNFNSALSKFVILEDAMSPVPGFEKEADLFFSEMKALGVRFCKTTDYSVY